MKKKVRKPCTAALVALALATPVAAELCTIDNVPAATLLIPYFEVEPTKKGKTNTVVSIQNTDAVPTVAHVTLWTDWGMATFSFDVFLTGYDIVTIDLRKILFEGELPQTAHATNDPNDTISPHGDNPFWDSAPDEPINPLFEGCDPRLPPSAIGSGTLGRLRQAHTGQDAGEGCLGSDYGDGLARGYVTIDNVKDCTLMLAGDSGYFGPDGVASDFNQLRGDFYITEKGGRGVAAGAAVAIEADPGFGANGLSYTFYGRYVDGTGSDHREPLGTTWSARHIERLPFGKGQRATQSDLIIWRDTLFSGLQVPRACRTGLPAWLPLDETQVVVFDEQSSAEQICQRVIDPTGDINPFCAPLATQRVRLGQGNLASTLDPGWIFFNLNHTPSAEETVAFGNRAQSYVTTALAVNRLRGTISTTALTSACGSSTSSSRRRR